jgi:hypothetical protein
MTTRPVEPIDLTTVEQLSSGFNRCFETRNAGEDLFAADAFFDFYPPFWRFQVQGAAAFSAQLRATADGPVSVTVLHTVPTASGFVTEHEETQHGPNREVARRLWRCEVRDGRITEVVGYCNGGWDDDLRQRHANEAPMLRP